MMEVVESGGFAVAVRIIGFTKGAKGNIGAKRASNK